MRLPTYSYLLIFVLQLQHLYILLTYSCWLESQSPGVYQLSSDICRVLWHVATKLRSTGLGADCHFMALAVDAIFRSQVQMIEILFFSAARCPIFRINSLVIPSFQGLDQLDGHAYLIPDMIFSVSGSRFGFPGGWKMNIHGIPIRRHGRQDSGGNQPAAPQLGRWWL